MTRSTSVSPWSLAARRDGFHWLEHPNLERERAFEGKYVIQTEELSVCG